MPPRQVSIAFQGGGARLVPLIAAAHAISELEIKGDLRVQAVSGSSAGSLAAFLLAARANFDNVVQALRDQEENIKAKFSSKSSFALKCRFILFLLLGKSVFQPTKFNNILTDILNQAGIDATQRIDNYVRDRELYIIISNIYQGTSDPAPLSTTIKDALRKSCAIPFIFSSHKNDDDGQHVDGGVFDNLPTDVLMPDGLDSAPVFAMGFAPETTTIAKSGVDYLTTVISSIISNRVAQSRSNIGEEQVLPIKTRLKTLDFEKMISIGINEEYAEVKRQTTAFFASWLAGSGQNLDPNFETRGRVPLIKLRHTESQLLHYIEDALGSCAASCTYARMKVTAKCLENPSFPDEIVVEQLLRCDSDQTLPGIVMPLISGSGYHFKTECYVHLDGPDGEEVRFLPFVIHDVPEVNGVPTRRTSAIMLLKGDPAKRKGRSLYFLKRETRYGFMAPLREGADFLGLNSSYFGADEVTLQLNVPRTASINAEWLTGGGSVPERLTVPPGSLTDSNYRGLAAKLNRSWKMRTGGEQVVM